MSRNTVRRWLLYVDETGDLSNRDARVAVGGVLALESHIMAAETMRAWLQEVAPLAPWPLHAAHLNEPLSYLLWYDMRRRDGAVTYDATLDRILAELDATAGNSLVANRARLASGARPRVKELRSMRRLLSYSNQAMLMAYVRRTRVALTLAIESLAAHAGPGPGALTLVAAGEAAPGCIGDPGLSPEARRGERYLTLLPALLRRTAEVVMQFRQGGQLDDSPRVSDEIRVFVATLDILDPTLEQVTPLHARHVHPAVDAANAVTDVWTRTVFDRILVYDANAHPLLVLADHGINRARQPLGDPRLPLREVEETIQTLSGLAVRSVGTQLAAAGEASIAGCWVLEQEAEWAALRLQNRSRAAVAS